MIGSWALWLMYAWLLGAIVAAYLSERKGYGEKVGLATGLLTSLIAIVIWLIVPPRRDSKWKTVGPFGRRKAEDVLPPGETTIDDAESTASSS